MRSFTIITKKNGRNLSLYSNKSQQHHFSQTPIIRKTNPISLSQDKSKISIISKLKTKTLEADRYSDCRGVHSSLSISTMPTSARPLTKTKTQKKKLRPNSKKVQAQKPMKSIGTFLGLNSIEHLSSENTPLNPNHSKYSKIKVFSKFKYRKQITLIISVDFIMNQFCFWEEDRSIFQNSSLIIKFWNKLTPYANLVWLARTESSARKLVNFTIDNNLNLDGILLISNSKKQSLKISYREFQEQAKIPPSDKVLIINSIRANDIRYLSPFQFKNSLPIITHSLTFIHFIKLDLNDKNRVNHIIKMISCQLPQSFPLQPILEQYYQEKQIYFGGMDQYELEQKLEDTDQEALLVVERAKKNISIYFEHSYGLTRKCEQNSMYFVIGDSIRRNFGIAKSICGYQKQYEHSIGNMKFKELASKYEQKYVKKTKRNYGRHVFLWEF